MEIGLGDRFPERVSAAMALARRGLSLSEAKQVIEELLESCQALVTLPTVEDVGAVVHDMGDAGVFALHLKISTANLLQATLGLSREEAERRCGAAVASVAPTSADAAAAPGGKAASRP